MIQLLQGDCIEVLKTLDAGSVQCCVTSPPYYGLRDYGTAKWEGGDSECNHEPDKSSPTSTLDGGKSTQGSAKFFRATCKKCGAIRIDSQIGLEPTPDEYVAKLVSVFREVKRVLRDDGTVFLNLGDSYFGSGKGGNPEGSKWAGFMVNKDREKAAMPRSNGRHAKPYGTSDKALEDYQGRGCLCGNLCDVCRVVYRRTSHTYDLLAPMLIASLSLTNPEYKELQTAHFPTSDLDHQVGRIFRAMPGLLNFQGHDDEQLHAFQESMPDGYSRQLLDVCLQRSNRGVCLLCARSLVDCVPGCADTLTSPCAHHSGVASTQDRFASTHDNAEIGGSSVYHISDKVYDLAYPYYTTASHQLKPKDLIGIPWRVAFALQADGWWLRSDIIWSKPNPMPESVTDRPTKAHEYIFLLSKAQRYYYDAEAVKEPASPDESVRDRDNTKLNNTPGRTKMGGLKTNHYETRNRRTVWEIATSPYKGAHFATFPPEIPEVCIKAGTKSGDIVLDPFCGSGTTGMVAQGHGRSFIGIELNPEYIELAKERIGMLFAEAA